MKEDVTKQIVSHVRRFYQVGDTVTYSTSIDGTKTGTTLQIEPTHRVVVGGTFPNHHIIIPDSDKGSEADFLQSQVKQF